MKTDRILLPIDLAKCPLDAIPLINSLAGHSTDVTVILLHVLNLNIMAPEARIYDDLCNEARWRLHRLAREQVHPQVDFCVRVRVGDPFEEIVAEAREQQVHLIVLPTFESSFWKRLFAPVVPRVVEKLARRAPCPVYTLRSAASFNCEMRWKSGQKITASSEGDSVGELRLTQPLRPSFAATPGPSFEHAKA
jgi:nucleotide-binding universal stress UspA family protein